MASLADAQIQSQRSLGFIGPLASFRPVGSVLKKTGCLQLFPYVFVVSPDILFTCQRNMDPADRLSGEALTREQHWYKFSYHITGKDRVCTYQSERTTLIISVPTKFARMDKKSQTFGDLHAVQNLYFYSSLKLLIPGNHKIFSEQSP